jgi:hypothetical protein
MIDAIAFQMDELAARRFRSNLKALNTTASCASTSNSLSLAASLASRQIRTFTPRAEALATSR